MSGDDTAGGVLAFATRFNTPGINPRTDRPWRDAAEFQARCREFTEMHGGEDRVVLVDDRAPMRARANEVLDAIASYDGRKLICVAFFCHGWQRGIEAGFDVRGLGHGATPRVLAEALRDEAGPGVIVPLMCCSTASGPDKGEAAGGDGGFADQLRDELCRVGLTNCRVDAHKTAGHTTRNPHVRRFEGEGRPAGGRGGRWIVAPNDPLFRTWRQWLSRDENDLWFPFLDTSAILRALTPP